MKKKDVKGKDMLGMMKLLVHNDSSVTRLSFTDILEGLIDLLHREGIDPSADIVLSSKVETFLDILGRTDEGTSKSQLLTAKNESRQTRERNFRNITLDKDTVVLHHLKVLIPTLVDNLGSENVSEGVVVRFHLLFLLHENIIIAAELLGIVDLVRDNIKSNYFSSHGLGPLNTKVAKTTKTENGNLGALTDTVTLERSKCSDTTTEERSGNFGSELVRNLYNKMFRTSPLLSETTISLIFGSVFITIIEGPDSMRRTQVFHVLLTEITLATRSRLTANTTTVTDLDARNVLTDLGHFTNDFVTNNTREFSRSPTFINSVLIAELDTFHLEQ
jgi:hypothetical protein